MPRRHPRHIILDHLHIDKIGHGWVGIAKTAEGKTVLVSWGVLPGSVIDAKVLRSKKDHILAQCIRIHKLAPEYQITQVKCPHYFFHPGDDQHNHRVWCGWCKWQIIPYDQQLSLKHQVIIDTFHPLADLVDRIGIQEVIPSPQQFGYRNKIEYSFGKYIVGSKKESDSWSSSPQSPWLYTHHDRNLGFHKQWLFSKIVDIDECLLATSKSGTIFQYLKKLLKQSWLPVYDQKMHTGFFRHLVIRQGIHTDQILVNLVIKSPDRVSYEGQIFDLTSKWNQFKDQLSQDIWLQNHVTTLCVTYNDGLADITRSQESQTEILRWSGLIQEVLYYDPNQVRFQVSPFSFFQTNTTGAEVLFATAMQMIWDYQGTILDLYCGTWSIGLSMLCNGIGEDLIGIEIVPEAIQDARINAELNQCKEKVYFVAGKAETMIESDSHIKSKLDQIWLVIVDPPRDWLHPDLTAFLCDLRFKHNFKLLYISCNPVTLCRDLTILQDAFEIQTLQPVDMFPHTHHCEMIAMMS